jgi:hypothetical protein
MYCKNKKYLENNRDTEQSNIKVRLIKINGCEHVSMNAAAQDMVRQ